jgi:hypothetical protein
MSKVTMIFFKGMLVQTPTHYPTGSDPVEFTLGNILVYIVFPVVLVVTWILVRRIQRKRNDGENAN